MKRLLIAGLLLLSGVSYAQQSKTDETLEFRRHWNVSLQGGVAHTVGETVFGDLLSPSAQVSASWNFHHAMAARFGLAGFQGKAAVNSNDYAYKFGQINADYVLNLAGLFGGYDHSRVVNPYLMAGFGLTCGFDNSQADAYKGALGYYWESPKLFIPVRIGAGVDFKLTEKLSLGLEANGNMLSDRFNSKIGYNPDWQINVLAGLKLNLGKTTAPSKAYAEKVAAEEAAAAALAAIAAEEAAKAAAEKAAKEAAEKAEAERLAAERTAKEAAERAAAERAAMCAENSENIFFSIGSSVISNVEAKKIVRLAEWMNAHEGFNVLLVGHADKKTGTSKRNLILSQSRAEAVKRMLVSHGVGSERIIADYKGDVVQPFDENVKNRVVVCTLE